MTNTELDPIEKMDPEELARIGVALNGRELWGWQRHLAAVLDCDERTVRKWYLGEREISKQNALLLRILKREVKYARGARPRIG